MTTAILTQPETVAVHRYVFSDVDWQAIVDALQEGVMVLDRDARILACNAATATILGRARAEILGATTRSLGLDIRGEDGQPLAPEELPSLKAVRTREPVHEVVVRITHGDGDPRWLSVAPRPWARRPARPRSS